MFVSPQQSQTSTTAARATASTILLQRIFILQEKEKKTVCHKESTTAKEKLKLALQSHGAPNHDLPDIVVFHLHTLLCGVALAATLPP
jgi:hypothetical protein